MRIALLDFHKKRSSEEGSKIKAALTANSAEVDVYRILLGDKRVHAENYSALVLSGAGKETRLDENLEKSRKTIDDFLRDNKPVLGICGGHHILALIFGNYVYNDEREEGLGLMHLTDSGKHDPLFNGMPSRFEAYQSHKKFIRYNGFGEILAFNERGFQAIRYGNVYGIQFHPEYTLNGEAVKIFYNFISMIK